MGDEKPKDSTLLKEIKTSDTSKAFTSNASNSSTVSLSLVPMP